MNNYLELKPVLNLMTRHKRSLTIGAYIRHRSLLFHGQLVCSVH